MALGGEGEYVLSKAIAPGPMDLFSSSCGGAGSGASSVDVMLALSDLPVARARREGGSFFEDGA